MWRKKNLRNPVDDLPEDHAVKRLLREHEQGLRRVHLRFDIRDILGLCKEQCADIDSLSQAGFFEKQKIKNRGRKIHSLCTSLIKRYAVTLGTNSLGEICQTVMQDLEYTKTDKTMNIFGNDLGERSHKMFTTYFSSAAEKFGN